MKDYEDYDSNNERDDADELIVADRVIALTIVVIVALLVWVFWP